MKKIFKFAALALLALPLLCACSDKYEKVKGDPLKAQIYTLDNGLKVYMTVNKEKPRLQTFIAVKVGGKNDPAETTGLAHYFEHLMFKGTESFGTSDYAAEKPMLDEIESLFEVYRKTTDEAERAAIYHRIDSISYEASKIAIPNEYDKLMAVIGAEGTNAWTSQDETVYVEDIPANQIDNWARIQADRFRHGVIRGFHTELETIYEEKNMSLTQDRRKVWEAVDELLFPNHPYGKQTVLGTQEHLKNPSITNVKKYHDTYYVPNNIAICVSGDFNPKEMVATIEKYFGDWEPNPSIPTLEFEPESPITEPVSKDVYGLEAENLAIAWRLPGASDLKCSAVAEIAGNILSNGSAGLIDLDVMQQQKALSAYGYASVQPDYGMFCMMGTPKEGQSLEDLRDILLAEIAKLRGGDFDEALLPATVNNINLAYQQMLESNRSRANLFVDSFISGVDWKDYCKVLDRYAAVTKEDIVSFAQQYLSDQNYIIVNKRKGEDLTVQKIAAPKITPIVTNRDLRSAFLDEITSTQVKPIDPVFVDFSKDMSRFELCPGVDVLYKKNETNDIFTLQYVYNIGSETDPTIGIASRYIEYLGTEEMTAEQIASEMYSLACSSGFSCGSNQTSMTVSGLSDNMQQAVGIAEALVLGAKADEGILGSLKADIFKQRKNSKLNQRACFNALGRYLSYGPEFISKVILGNEALAGVTSEELLSSLKDLFFKGHEIYYYGPLSEAQLKKVLLASHKVEAGCEPLERKYPVSLQTEGSSVVLAQYDAKQLYYYQCSDRGEKLDLDSDPAHTLYNEYFGGGMNSIVFQEMREARGLAYSAWAYLSSPSYKDDTYSFTAFIATQNDKMQTAIEAFDDIINNMPESEAAFNIAKEGILGRLRTARTTGTGVLNAYVRCRDLGLSEPLDRQRFEKIQDMTLEDVKAFQQKWIKDRDYTYGILGDIKDLDMDYLRTLGPVKEVSLEEIFGY